jgi:precorrin-6B methylase 1
MVVERFLNGARPVYERATERGRMLPPGLEYVDSWIDERRLDRCFQLMETGDPSLFDHWIAQWNDLADFEVVPVISSAEAAARISHP